MYIKISGNEYNNYSISQLKSDNKDVSFPLAVTDKLLAEFGVYQLTQAPKPAYDPIAQTCSEGTPALIDGAWTQQWVITDLDAETVAKNQAAYAANLRASVVEQTQERLDNFARTRGYDGILSACTYATSTVPKFQREGQYCVTARDATWASLYQILAEVEAGTRPMPAGFEAIEPLLPAVSWP